MKNQAIINQFFESYLKKDMLGIKKAMSDNIKWAFLGRHKLAGIKTGIAEVIAFFDTMSVIMNKSKAAVEKLVIGSNENYIIECQHIKTNRNDGININHHICVLWTFKDGRIVSGKHFFADPVAADNFFNAMAV